MLAKGIKLPPALARRVSDLNGSLQRMATRRATAAAEAAVATAATAGAGAAAADSDSDGDSAERRSALVASAVNKIADETLQDFFAGIS